IHFRDNGRKNSVRDFIENLNEQIGSVHGEKGVEINGNWKYLKSVFGSESGGNNLWQICVLRNGKRVPLSADEDLPEKENIFLCCASVDDVKRSWFEDGADANDPCALYWMGVCWERGIDGEVDFKKAVEYFSALAKTDFAFPEVFKIRMGERYNYRQIDDRKFSKEVLGAWKQCWEKEVDELKEILFERWVGTRDDYMKIKQKCDYISRYYGRSIQETRLLKFAREYSNWLDSYERKYQLHAKRCRRVKYGHNYIDRIGCQDESIRFDSDYKPGKNFEFTQKEPWEEIEVSYRKRKRGTDDNQGTDCEFLKGLGDLKLSDPHRVFKKTQLEITIKPLNGKTVHELWNEIF
ncbi:MAG: hypothetical protein IJX22_01535, partial [Opitutales bacterium]|nr:hypothetical protein [Opitutales bacterium]